MMLKMPTDRLDDLTFDTNSFDLSVQDGKVSVTAVFGEASMMMHSCYKNTRLTYR